MNKVTFGLIAGLLFGAFSVLIMIPLPEPDKKKKTEAMIGAFCERFMTGFLIPTADIGINYIAAGILIGLGLSIGTAIVTRAYKPIIIIGLMGGLIIGVLANMFVR